MPASIARTDRQTAGIAAYPQFDPAFLPSGSMACAILGPKSRAGLIAYPVVPPSDKPIAHITAALRTLPSPATEPVATFSEKIAPTTVTSTKVPIISLSRFAPILGMAGEVEKHASFKFASSVTFQCGRKWSNTAIAPVNAPRNCAAKKGKNFEKSPDTIAIPSVMAGFRWLSGLPQAVAVKLPAITANAQPAAMAIHPAPSALECRSETFATTPFPRRMRTRVPMNSPKNFAPILVSDLRPRHQVNCACFIETAFVAWLNSTFVRPLQFTCLWPPGVSSGLICY